MVCKCLAVTFSSSSFKWGGTICLWYLYPYIYWYFLISSYYLTVSNGHSLTAMKTHSCHFLVKQFQMGGTICLWCLHVFSMCWYFLISSYYLTVLDGRSLTALKSVEVTQSSDSFIWGGLSVFGICIHIYTGISLYFLISWLPLVSTCFLCTGISLYLPIVWLFQMGTHWLHWKALRSLRALTVSYRGVHLPLVSTCFLYVLVISLYLPIIWLFRMGTHWLHWKALRSLRALTVSYRGGSICLWCLHVFSMCWLFPYIFLLFDCFEWALIDCIEKLRGHSELWQFHMGGDHLSLVSVSLYILVFPYIF